MEMNRILINLIGKLLKILQIRHSDMTSLNRIFSVQIIRPIKKQVNQ